MLGAFGSVLLFLIALIASTIVGSYVLGYAARCLLVVVQETAAGADEPSWPEEPLLDWIGQSVHVVLLPWVVLVPVGFLAARLKDDLFPNDDGLRLIVLAVPALWLLFPVALLSSLASVSRWNVFRPVILARLARLFPATVLFYLVSGALAALGATTWYLALFPGWGPVVLPVAAAATGLLLLVYGRLLGRLAWLIGRLGPLNRPIDPEEDAPPAPKKRRKKPPRAVVSDPWAVTEETVEKESYGGRYDDGYGLSDDAPVKPPSLNVLVGNIENVTGSPKDRPKPRGSKPKQAEPTAPSVSDLPMLSCLFRGLHTFPYSGKTGVAWMRLSLGFLALGACLTALLAFKPF